MVTLKTCLCVRVARMRGGVCKPSGPRPGCAPGGVLLTSRACARMQAGRTHAWIACIGVSAGQSATVDGMRSASRHTAPHGGCWWVKRQIKLVCSGVGREGSQPVSMHTRMQDGGGQVAASWAGSGGLPRQLPRLTQGRARTQSDLGAARALRRSGDADGETGSLPLRRPRPVGSLSLT